MTAPGNSRSPPWVDGRLHHLRVVDGDGALFLVPPEWIEPPGAGRLKGGPVCAEVAA